MPTPHAVYEHIVEALALLLLLSGLDDLVPTLLVVWSWARKKGLPSLVPEPEEERRIAIFVPCWREAAVIDEMVRRNLSAIRYDNFDLFLGAYPNDEATLAAGVRLAATLRRVHTAECPHVGPYVQSRLPQLGLPTHGPFRGGALRSIRHHRCA